jgi:hypothetical protein
VRSVYACDPHRNRVRFTFTFQQRPRIVVQASGLDSPPAASEQSFEVKIVQRFENSVKFGRLHGFTDPLKELIVKR